MTFSEGTFTAPHRWCPNPSAWTAHDNQGTEVEVIEMVAGLIRGLQPEYVIETGTHRGFMARAIGEALLVNGHGRLDTFEVDQALYEEAVGRGVGLPVHYRLSSAVEFEPDRPIDFAWFDSLIHLRVPEYGKYRNMMHDRTVVGFHDTGPQHVLRPQLNALMGDLQMIDLPTPRGVVFGRLWQ